MLALDHESRGAQSTIGPLIGHKAGQLFRNACEAGRGTGVYGSLREYGLSCAATESL